MQDLLLVMLSLWSPETRRSSNSDGFPCFSFIFLHSLISPWKPQKEETDITFLGDDDDDGLGNGPHQKIFFATVPPDLFQFMVPAPSLKESSCCLLVPSKSKYLQFLALFLCSGVVSNMLEFFLFYALLSTITTKVSKGKKGKKKGNNK